MSRNRKPQTSLSNFLGFSRKSAHHSGSDSKGSETELKTFAEDGWTFVQVDQAQGGDAQLHNSDMDTTDGRYSPSSPVGVLRKKPGKNLSPMLSSRSNSTSGGRSPRSVRPTSPGGSGIQRRASGRSSRPTTNLEVQQNGGSKTRGTSPSRLRASSPSRGSVRSSSPSRGSSRSKKGANGDASKSQQNGTKDDKESGSSSPAFAKIRDTLRISRPKKKKGQKNKKLAYSVDPPAYAPVELNLHNPSKYQDPFETSYTVNGEEQKLGQDHEFEHVSIPHNKPEYCDHCGDMAWGLYRQVLRCSKCDFIVHRKCESKITIDCSSRLEQAVLSHDKQVEDVARIAATEEEEEKKKKEKEKETTDHPPPSRAHSAPSTVEHSTDSSSSSSSTATSSSLTPSTTGASATSGGMSYVTREYVTEKSKLVKKVREYNRKTTPVHHIHMKSSHQDPTLIEYQGFIRVHMCVQRPIHVSTAITRTSWYRLMRPVKERSMNMESGIETAFYLPTDTNRLVHISNSTTTKELVQILLKKFCVTDNPKKFSLYEEYGSDCRRLFEEDHPLEIALDASTAHRNSKLILRDNTYSTIQWDAFTHPELSNFIQILQREEEIYIKKLEERFKVWKRSINKALKEKCMEEVSRQTQQNLGPGKHRGNLGGLGTKSSLGRGSPTPALKVESVI